MSQLFAGLGAIITVLVIFLLVRWSGRWSSRAQEKLFREKTSPLADVRGCCLVRETYYEQPGVAQILNGKLCIYTVLGDIIEIPMSQVKWLKDKKTMLPFGRYPWWGKTCFRLETPKTSGLVLGVDDPEPWTQAFTDGQRNNAPVP